MQKGLEMPSNGSGSEHTPAPWTLERTLFIALKNVMDYLGEGERDIVQSAWWVNDKKFARKALAMAAREEGASLPKS